MVTSSYPWWQVGRVEAELMHDPAGLGAVGGAALVEYQRLPHADDGTRRGAADLPVLAGGLPVAGLGGAVRARPGRVLAVPEAEEVPLAGRQFRHLCTPNKSVTVSEKWSLLVVTNKLHKS